VAQTAVLLVAAAALGIGGVWWLVGQLHEGTAMSTGPAQIAAPLNYRFTFPEAPWERDATTQQRFRAFLAMRRTDPNAWLALAARDYRTRTPRDGEVLDEAVRRLEGYFSDVEWQQTEDGQLAGLAAQRLVFKGRSSNGVCGGECCVLTHQGIAYWFYTWAPAAPDLMDRAAPEFPALRGRFTLLKERDGWTERRPKPRTFHGTRLAYTLRDTEGLWEEWTPATDYDAAADLALHGKDRVESQDADKTATVLVLVLPKPDSPPPDVAVAQAYLEEQHKRDYPQTRLRPAADGPAPDGTASPGSMIKLHVQNGEARERFVMLAVHRHRDHLLVLQGECSWQRRSLWEREFTRLLGTIRIEAGPP
jgi:hypothetical protein